MSKRKEIHPYDIDIDLKRHSYKKYRTHIIRSAIENSIKRSEFGKSIGREISILQGETEVSSISNYWCVLIATEYMR